MRSTLTVVLSVLFGAGLLAALAQLDALPPVWAAAAAVGSGVLFALTVQGAGLSGVPQAMALGASGALAHEVLRPMVPLIAAGVLLAFAFASRAVRARSIPALVFHIVLAFVCGVVASWVVLSHQGAGTALFLVALSVGAVLAAVPLGVPVDDPISHAFLRQAARVRGVTRVRMLRAAALRRRMHAQAEELSTEDAGRLEHAWGELARLAEERAEMPNTRRISLDKSIARHLLCLARIHRAIFHRRSLSADLDAPILAQLRLQRDDIEAEVAGLAELSIFDEPEPRSARLLAPPPKEALEQAPEQAPGQAPEQMAGQAPEQAPEQMAGHAA